MMPLDIADIFQNLPIPIPSFSKHPGFCIFVVSYYIVALLMQFSAMYQDFILVFQPRKIKSLLDIAIRPFIYYCIGGIVITIFFSSPTVRASFGLIHILCLLIYGMGRLTRWGISKIRKHFQDPNLRLISY